METVHTHSSPLDAYLQGQGYLDASSRDHSQPTTPSTSSRAEFARDLASTDTELSSPQPSFAPKSGLRSLAAFTTNLPQPIKAEARSRNSLRRIHHAWSRAVNSRLGRADNARFLEHFRYVIVASQLLNEYLDHGLSAPSRTSVQPLDGSADVPSLPIITTSLYGAAATAALAFGIVYLIHWARGNLGKAILVLLVLLLVACVGYGYIRRHWLRFLRRNAVAEVTALTANWQAFELSATSALSLIQEVELVSRGYQLSTPLPPASRLEDQAIPRRCVRLRDSLRKAYATVLPSCAATCSTLRTLIDEDDLEKYFDVYDISLADVRDALDLELNPCVLTEGDAESLKALRLLSYRTSVLRRVVLCSLLTLGADGGKPDFYRWRTATEAMRQLSEAVAPAAERIQQCLRDMETTVTLPTSPTPGKAAISAGREKLRGQVRKISMLSSGIKTLQAKMQILREESNRSIEQSDDLTDLGPGLMTQYEAIGEDLKDLMHAWESGKTALQSSLTKQERRISHASSARSAISSIGGLTAVEEDGGGPAAALKALVGDTSPMTLNLSNRSSMATTPSDEEVFEAIALPRQRSTLTREERIAKMHDERERQALLRAKRDANTSMLRELESVINLRPKGPTIATRVTSI